MAQCYFCSLKFGHSEICVIKNYFIFLMTFLLQEVVSAYH